MLKDDLLFMMGAAAGIGMYVGLTKIAENKKTVKNKVNKYIDEMTAPFEN